MAHHRKRVILLHANRFRQRTLLGVADKFREEWRIPHLLSCYCCKLNERNDALRWVEQAIDVAGKVEIRLKTLDEPDLEPLWIDLGEI